MNKGVIKVKLIKLTKVNNLKKQKVIRAVFSLGVLCTILLTICGCMQVNRVVAKEFKVNRSVAAKVLDPVLDIIFSS